MNEPFSRRATSLAYTVAVIVCFVIATVYLLLYGDAAIDLNQMR